MVCEDFTITDLQLGRQPRGHEGWVWLTLSNYWNILLQVCSHWQAVQVDSCESQFSVLLWWFWGSWIKSYCVYCLNIFMRLDINWHLITFIVTMFTLLSMLLMTLTMTNIYVVLSPSDSDNITLSTLHHDSTKQSRLTPGEGIISTQGCYSSFFLRNILLKR